MVRLCWLFDFMNRLNMCLCLPCFTNVATSTLRMKICCGNKNQEVLFFIVLSIHWDLQNLIFITLLFSFLLICPLWMYLYVLPSALIRCKSICCPPLLSFRPANIIKPPPADISTWYFLLFQPAVSSLSALLVSPSLLNCSDSLCLLFPFLLLNSVQTGEDTSGYQGSDKTQLWMMDEKLILPPPQFKLSAVQLFPVWIFLTKFCSGLQWSAS